MAGAPRDGRRRGRGFRDGVRQRRRDRPRRRSPQHRGRATRRRPRRQRPHGRRARGGGARRGVRSGRRRACGLGMCARRGRVRPQCACLVARRPACRDGPSSDGAGDPAARGRPRRNLRATDRPDQPRRAPARLPQVALARPAHVDELEGVERAADVLPAQAHHDRRGRRRSRACRAQHAGQLGRNVPRRSRRG